MKNKMKGVKDLRNQQTKSKKKQNEIIEKN